MPTTYNAAVDTMFGLFKSAWDTGAAVIVGEVPEVRWQNVPETTKPDPAKYFARVSQQPVTSRQSSLSNCVGEPQQRRYETAGVLFIQLFFPKTDDQAADRGRQLSVLARAAYRGKTVGGIEFKNVRINELSPQESWFRANVIAEYEFDELG